ncbi:hypothetical protein [Megalodesulfovibrio gigas]|uniref:Uncharacterized protein n=1 Tax=Megalodesulfovibrio gigas (strain ATCC 19364 / DSM 1382 / NCIMB 9332 / VKM B-1759) TaxID=1121448 RepID=T2GCP8_MEGG1|nr:hypothetical protein [Megalodesulfovibrio gigas]AGW13677.1 hypothetical protein DGI_1891 [Megalodesulfovibrio gigas DSM 1382 = ATCC 19364]
MRAAILASLVVSLMIPTPIRAQQFRVPLGLYRQETAAVDGWQLLKTRFPDLLEGCLPELETVETEAGPLLRLTVFMEDAAQARTLERAMQRDAPAMEAEAETTQRPRLSSNGRFTVTAGGVPGQNAGFVFDQNRIYVGLRTDAGRVSITPGLAANAEGDAGPYAGIEVRW